MFTLGGMLLLLAFTVYVHVTIMPAKIARIQDCGRRMPTMQLRVLARVEAMERWQFLLRASIYAQIVMALLWARAIWR